MTDIGKLFFYWQRLGQEKKSFSNRIIFVIIFFSPQGFWDTRKGSQPVEVTPIEKSHRDPIFDVRFIQSKTGKFYIVTLRFFLGILKTLFI